MTEPYPSLPQNELNDLAQKLAERPSPHYPKERLTMHAAGLIIQKDVLYVPDGPWETRGHPNRLSAPADQVLHPELPTDKNDATNFKLAPALTANWRAQGYLVDQYGRPINPHWQTYLSDDKLGLTTGPGMFWRYGNNGVTDALVSRKTGNDEREWLLIQRKDSGEWATPGGYIDAGDKDTTATALREVEEETGLHVATAKYGARVILRSFEVSRRITLNSWSEINTVLIEADEEVLRQAQLNPGDDAKDAMWATHAYARDTLHAPERYLRYIEAANGELSG